MYELYLKYFYRKDSSAENELDNNKIAASTLNLRNESIPFKLSFITASGGLSSIILFFLIYPTLYRRRITPYRQYGLSAIMEPMLRPFVRTFLTSSTFSFAFAVAYCFATHKSKDKKV